MKFALSVFGYGIQPYLACSQGRVFLMLGLWNSILPKRNVWRLVEGTVVALDFSLLASLSCGLAAKYSFLFLKNRFTSILEKPERYIIMKVTWFYTGQNAWKNSCKPEWKQKNPRKSNPLPLYIPFFTKKVPLSYTFYQWQMLPLPHTLFRTLYPFGRSTAVNQYTVFFLHRNQSQK